MLAVVGLASQGATYGTGYAQAKMLVEGNARLPVTFFLLKFLATIASYLSEIPGGIWRCAQSRCRLAPAIHGPW
jgi:H+/Cl- antiporter ClcA